MWSTDSPNPSHPPPGWRKARLRYFTRPHFFRERFGARVWKLSVDAGLGCPNRDGTLGAGGCVFCDPASFSPSRRQPRRSVSDQIAAGAARLRARRGAERFVAYFQPGTNTYAPVERLEALYDEALAHPQVVGLIVGTRPDCTGDEALDLLERMARRTWVSVEYGVQSIHDRSLRWMNRGHLYAAFLDACAWSRGRGFEVGVHLILGLPGESQEDMLATVREMARLGVDSVKLHNLHAVRDTPLAEMVARGEVRLPELDEHVTRVVDFLEQLHPTCVVDRISGDAPPEYLVGPAWCQDKAEIRRRVEAEFVRRGTHQGFAFEPASRTD
jgi:uncharacterized protein